jgi:hypothetical protein
MFLLQPINKTGIDQQQRECLWVALGWLIQYFTYGLLAFILKILPNDCNAHALVKIY